MRRRREEARGIRRMGARLQLSRFREECQGDGTARREQARHRDCAECARAVQLRGHQGEDRRRAVGGVLHRRGAGRRRRMECVGLRHHGGVSSPRASSVRNIFTRPRDAERHRAAQGASDCASPCEGGGGRSHACGRHVRQVRLAHCRRNVCRAAECAERDRRQPPYALAFARGWRQAFAAAAELHGGLRRGAGDAWFRLRAAHGRM